GNRLRPVTTHLARRHAAGLSSPSHPSNGRADGNPELFGRPIAGQPASLDRRNHPLPKIVRVRLAHPCWPPAQPARRIRNALIWESQIDSISLHPALALRPIACFPSLPIPPAGRTLSAPR